MSTVFSIAEKKLAEIYGYIFGEWNKYYWERYNRPNTASPNKDKKCKVFEDISYGTQMNEQSKKVKLCVM